MQLSDEEQRAVRLSLLRYGLQRGISVGLAAQNLRDEGMGRIEPEVVEREFHYLAHGQKALMELCSDPLGPAVKRYRTTPAGEDYLVEHGK